jgi:hypothetical protein
MLHIEANVDAGDNGDDELNYEDVFTMEDMLVLGFSMGNLWVQISYTVPVPVYTVPIMGTSTS